MFRFLFPSVLTLFFSLGCTDLMLRPDNIDYAPAFERNHVVEEGFIASGARIALHYWRIPAQDLDRHVYPTSKGLIVLIHGNGNNLTDHISRHLWLAENGYDLLIFDYRGHGASTGLAGVAGSYEDVVSALDFGDAYALQHRQPLYFYGQSLGATLLLKAVSQNPGRWHPESVIAEDPFFSFKKLARERVMAFGAPSLIGLFSYLTFSDRYGLREDELASVSPVPVLLFCSSEDPVVSAHHCRAVNKSLQEPKTMVTYREKGHLQAMMNPEAKSRLILLQTLAEVSVPPLIARNRRGGP